MIQCVTNNIIYNHLSLANMDTLAATYDYLISMEAFVE